MYCAAEAQAAEDLLNRARGGEASTSTSNGHSNGAPPERFDGRAFRRKLASSGRYQRNPRNDKDSLALMEEHGVGYSTTGLVAQMRENGNLWQFRRVDAFDRQPLQHQADMCLHECSAAGLCLLCACAFTLASLLGKQAEAPFCRDLTIRLAEAYGYCWGVERAVQMAYEARRQFPGHRVHVTNEIIHNPAVNQVQPRRLCHINLHQHSQL